MRDWQQSSDRVPANKGGGGGGERERGGEKERGGEGGEKERGNEKGGGERERERENRHSSSLKTVCSRDGNSGLIPSCPSRNLDGLVSLTTAASSSNEIGDENHDDKTGEGSPHSNGNDAVGLVII